MRAQLAGCCCKCSELANLYSVPSTCVDISFSPMVCDLAVSQITESSAILSWSAAGVYTYTIYLGSVAVARGITDTMYAFTGLLPGTTYTAAITTGGGCESAKISVSFTTVTV